MITKAVFTSENLAKVDASAAQVTYLLGAVDRLDGKLPLFDEKGDKIPQPTIDAVVSKGWAEPVYTRTFLKDMDIYRITDLGRKILKEVAGD